MLIKNKKALEAGNTLVWLVATLLIFVLMMLYLFFVFLAFGKNGGKNEVNVIIESENDPILLQSFLSFLEKETIVNGEKMKVKDLVNTDSKNKYEKEQKFKELANEFEKNNKFKETNSIEIYNSKQTNYLGSFFEGMAYQFDSASTASSKDTTLFCVLISEDKPVFICIRGYK
jgi:hypothetical protein